MSIRNRSRICDATLAAVALGAAFAASLLHAGKPPAEPPVQYTMTFIPDLVGVSGMNNRGDIVDGAMLYTDGKTYDLTIPVNTALPVGGVLSNVADITDNWRITGTFSSGELWHAFRCTLAFENGKLVAKDLQRLEAPPEFPISYGYAINTSGEVVGQLQSLAAPPNNQWRAFRWPIGQNWPIQINPDAFGEARDISDSGKITGFIRSSGQPHAFLYEPGNVVVKDLGALPRCAVSYGNGVNYDGQVAGESYDSRPVHAFRYTPNVGMVDLGTFSTDYWSRAASINTAGDVVGASIDRNHVVHGYLYTDITKMTSLAPLIKVFPAGLDFNSLEPLAVNDYPGHVYNGHVFGHIAGTARVNGVFGAFLLTPIQ